MLNTYIDSSKKLMIKIPNLKMVIMYEFQNTKIFLLRDVLQNWSEEIFVIKIDKNTFHKLMLLTISMVKKLLEHFIKKNIKRIINKNLG